MKGKYQGQNEIIINTSPQEVWSVLIDGTKLSSWMPIVKHTTGSTESMNAVRSCDVNFNGKNGKVSERCVLFEKHKNIGWEMEQDTFGFSKMFSHFGFSFELVPINETSTKVINKGYGNPRNILASLMNFFMMKRKSSGIREKALMGLKRVLEAASEIQ